MEGRRCSTASSGGESTSAASISHASSAGPGRPCCCCTAIRKPMSYVGAGGAGPASRYTVVLADLRGYGDFSKPRCSADQTNYSFRAFAEDQLGLMQRLGFGRFHLIGHDRGGRTGHRMALDHADAVLSLAVLDIVPTLAMFMQTDHRLARAYWHWYFLAQPEPFPERLIGHDPDFFFETCLVGWERRTSVPSTPRCLPNIAGRGARRR